ncbi:putative ribonuclease H-like domain-containing protein [Tanacetum coccineum]
MLVCCFLSQEEPKKVLSKPSNEGELEQNGFRNKRDERVLLSRTQAAPSSSRIQTEKKVWTMIMSFLYGNITEEGVCQTPPGFEDPAHPNKVYRVVKALYGLHQAPRAWYERLSTFLLKHGYRRGAIDKTLFIKKDRRDIQCMIQWVELTFFLGFKSKQSMVYFLSQDKYVKDILNKFDFRTIKPASTPIEAHKSLGKDEEGEDVDISSHSKDSLSLEAFRVEDYAGDNMTEDQLRRTISLAEDYTLQVINDVPHIRANMLARKDLVSEATIRADLLFDDENGVDCFPKQVIWDTLRDIGYEGHISNGTPFLMYPRIVQHAAEEEQSTSPHSRLRLFSTPLSTRYCFPSCTATLWTAEIQRTADFQAKRRRKRNQKKVSFSQNWRNKDEELVSEDPRKLDLETTQSTARQGTITPRTLNFEDEAGPSSPLHPIQVMDYEEQHTAAEVLVSISRPRGLSVPGPPTQTQTSPHNSRANKSLQGFDTFVGRYDHVLDMTGDLNIIWETAESVMMTSEGSRRMGNHKKEELMIRMLDHGMEVEEETETAITLIHLFILWTTEDGDNS